MTARWTGPRRWTRAQDLRFLAELATLALAALTTYAACLVLAALRG